MQTTTNPKPKKLLKRIRLMTMEWSTPSPQAEPVGLRAVSRVVSTSHVPASRTHTQLVKYCSNFVNFDVATTCEQHSHTPVYIMAKSYKKKSKNFQKKNINIAYIYYNIMPISSFTVIKICAKSNNKYRQIALFQKLFQELH